MYIVFIYNLKIWKDTFEVLHSTRVWSGAGTWQSQTSPVQYLQTHSLLFIYLIEHTID